ncbi:sigma-70 family RNA polymerase sigma factor [Streptomyces sp. NPDC028635]|uniref:RNA polymerase sigma factor n=1 Tax=Streptomyces sp. NPDC028635 TaxID=3154800 RepID=UPI003410E56B
MEPTDADLVACARRGDAASTAVLIARHRARMCAVAVAMLGPCAEVDDVVQEASLVALGRLDYLRSPPAAGHWLTATTRNLCRQALAHRSRVRPTAQQLEPDRATLTDPAAILDSGATSDWVWHAVNSLSPALRDVVVLRYFSQARAYDSIAAVLGIPVGTVRSRLNQARRLLTTSLADLEAAAHPDHHRLVEARRSLFGEIYTEYNRGGRCSVFRSALRSDAELRAVGVPGVEKGREAIGDWLESDIDIGVRVRLHDVIAGEAITVLEGAFLNPPDHPDHCPAVTTHVYLHDADGIASVLLHYGDAPPQDNAENETV